MNIAEKMKEYGLFAAPLNNGDWMVGKSNCVYHLDIRTDHYKDPRLSIASTLPKAIQKWRKELTCPRCGGVNGKHRQVDDPAAGNSHMLTKMPCPLNKE